MFCKKCGRELPDTAGYCGFCGEVLKPGTTASQQAPTYQQPTYQQPVYQQAPTYQQPAYQQPTGYQQACTQPSTVAKKTPSVFSKLPFLLVVASIVIEFMFSFIIFIQYRRMGVEFDYIVRSLFRLIIGNATLIGVTLTVMLTASKAEQVKKTGGMVAVIGSAAITFIALLIFVMYFIPGSYGASSLLGWINGIWFSDIVSNLSWLSYIISFSFLLHMMMQIIILVLRVGATVLSFIYGLKTMTNKQ